MNEWYMCGLNSITNVFTGLKFKSALISFQTLAPFLIRPICNIDLLIKYSSPSQTSKPDFGTTR